MDDSELLRRFEDRSLPLADWPPRAHVRVAFLHLRSQPFDEALKRLRAGIQGYDAAHGVPEGPVQGYHETTTHAFLSLIDVTMRTHGETFPTPDADAFCDTHPQLLCKHLLHLFDSPGCRARPEARIRFVEPDLTPLPRAPFQLNRAVRLG